MHLQARKTRHVVRKSDLLRIWWCRNVFDFAFCNRIKQSCSFESITDHLNTILPKYFHNRSTTSICYWQLALTRNRRLFRFSTNSCNFLTSTDATFSVVDIWNLINLNDGEKKKKQLRMKRIEIRCCITNHPRMLKCLCWSHSHVGINNEQITYHTFCCEMKHVKIHLETREMLQKRFFDIKSAHCVSQWRTFSAHIIPPRWVEIVISLKDLLKQLCLLLVLERRIPTQKDIQNNTNTPHITLWRIAFTSLPSIQYKESQLYVPTPNNQKKGSWIFPFPNKNHKTFKTSGAT